MSRGIFTFLQLFFAAPPRLWVLGVREAFFIRNQRKIRAARGAAGSFAAHARRLTALPRATIIYYYT